MTRSRKTATHAHRTGAAEDGSVTCECGKPFADDDAWRVHYEEMHDEDERARLEGRDPTGEAERQRRFDEAHAAMLAARDEAAAAAEDSDGD